MFMRKDKLQNLADILKKYGKIILPVVLIAVVATVVVLILDGGQSDKGADPLVPESLLSESVATDVSSGEESGQIPEVPLEENEEGSLYTLMCVYYNALATGDVETIQSISNYVNDTDVIRIQELSKYIDLYPVIQIYKKPGPVDGSWIAYVYTKVEFSGYDIEVPGLQTFYVCTDANGELYLNEGETSEEVLNYITTVSLQDDVVELNNRVNAEYDEVRLNHAKLADYINELQLEISRSTGEAIAAQVAGNSEAQSSENSQESGENTQGGGEQPADQPADASGESILTATVTTTVNVRVSDSELSDKIGKLTGGSQVQVYEQRINGWSHISYNGQDGYVKSQYLAIAGQESEGESSQSGTRKSATTNVKIRSSASATSEQLGMVIGGDSVEVLSESGEWSQIRYNGITGYVKSEYLQ